MADRYTYLPHLGLFSGLIFGIDCLVKSVNNGKKVLAGIWLIVAVILCPITKKQVRVWKDSMNLFTHATQVTERNALAYYTLGQFVSEKKDYKTAESYYRQALKIDPDYPDGDASLGLTYAHQGKIKQALPYLEKAVQKAPFAKAKHLYNLGVAYRDLGKFEAAEKQFIEALSLRAPYDQAKFQLGLVLIGQERYEEAQSVLKEVLSAKDRTTPSLLDAIYYPDDSVNKFRIYFRLGTVSEYLGNIEAAIDYYKEALLLQPGQAKASENLAKAYNNHGAAVGNSGNFKEAARYFELAIKYKSDYPDAINNLAKAKRALESTQKAK